MQDLRSHIHLFYCQHFILYRSKPGRTVFKPRKAVHQGLENIVTVFLDQIVDVAEYATILRAKTIRQTKQDLSEVY